MSSSSKHEITCLLAAWSDGDRQALEKLVPLVHAELHRLARRYLSHEQPGHTLQTSALVNEAYVRLIDWKNARFENRAHFFGVAAKLMRRILVDFARSRSHAKGAQQVSLDQALIISNEPSSDLIALDDALKALAEVDPRKAQIVELRFFGGMSVEETAELLKISPVTVIREWNRAKAWLYCELSPGSLHEGRTLQAN